MTGTKWQQVQGISMCCWLLLTYRAPSLALPLSVEYSAIYCHESDRESWFWCQVSDGGLKTQSAAVRKEST